jgi:hypothetical protein
MTPPETLTNHPVGRPRTRVTPEQVWQKWSQGDSWRQIGKALGIGTATAMRLLNRFFQANDRVPSQLPRDESPISRGPYIIQEP